MLQQTDTDVFVSAFPRAVAAAGAIPVMLTRDAHPAGLLDRIDGILLAGGQDIDPRVYGQNPEQHTNALDPQRDAYECELVRQAIRRGKPVLGVCRGHQLLNVALGGTLQVTVQVVLGVAS